jgi:hypothetical protein
MPTGIQAEPSGGHIMFRRIFIVAAALTLLLSGCAWPQLRAIRGNGNLASRDYPITGFTEVEAHNAFDVTVKQGEPFQVRVTTDDNLFPYLVVEKVGDRLIVRYDNREFNNFRATREEATITMPDLTGLRGSGATHFRLPDFKTQNAVDANLSGASQLSGALDAPWLQLEASGASRGVLSGAIPHVQLTLSGASQFDLGQLTTDAASARLSGGSSATVNPAQALDYHLSGASTLRYYGNPSIGEQEESGGSKALQLP